MLTYRENRFVWVAGDTAGRLLADEIGLTLSAPATMRVGKNVYFTTDPYAALPLWQWADAAAKEKLAALHAEHQQSTALSSDVSIAGPPDKEYMPFQKAGIEYALSRAHALIGDDMGLGKTIQAIGLANEMQAKRVLVICPAQVRLNWRREIFEWSVNPRPVVSPITKTADGVNPNANWIITSYDLARSETVHKLLMRLEYDLIVLDEAHYLKTIDAQRTRAIFGGGEAAFKDAHLASRAKKVVALTGTPLPNRPRECYTLARALCWDSIDWMSFDRFKHRYNPVHTWENGHKDERTGRLPELQARLRCNFMVRRQKHEVLKDLPAERYELVYVEDNGAIKQALKAERMLDINPSDLTGADVATLGHVSTVRRLMGEAKTPRVLQYVDMLLDGGLDKLVLFAWHRSVMDALETGLAQYGVVRVDGGTSGNRKAMLVEQFVNDDRKQIFLGNLMAAGTGIDGLQHVCSHMVFAEASWTPGENNQCVGRLARYGQKESVLAQFLVAQGGFDERVLGAEIEKRHVIDRSLDRKVG